jgi:hypothetical protein
MATGAPAASPVVNPATGALELVFDPLTRDLIDAPDGWFVEGTDSRSAVLCQLESRYQAWWGSPFDGSRICDILRDDDPATPQDLRDKVLRAMQALVDDGIVSEHRLAVRPGLEAPEGDRRGGDRRPRERRDLVPGRDARQRTRRRTGSVDLDLPARRHQDAQGGDAGAQGVGGSRARDAGRRDRG